ncbi:hypothetical protein DFH09DRAFT_1166690 [Mycena vulgaris]|nr:hypothetical protein DFH09DRAFT_1166690 [Mycena vulgaris]
MSSYWVKVPEPRLHPEDDNHRKQEPFKTAFATVRNNRHIISAMINRMVDQVLQSTFWLEIITRWTIYCLGLSLHPHEAAHLFVCVLWAEEPLNPTKEDGLPLLQQAQSRAVRIRNQPDCPFIKKSVPGKIAMVDGGVEENDDESDPTLSDSDEHDPHDMLEEPSGELLSMDVDQDENPRPPNIGLTSREKSSWNNDVQNVNVLSFVISSWKDRLDILFGKSQKPNGPLPDPGKLIQEMNYLYKKNYDRPEFRQFFKESGLAAFFEEICNPKCLFQLDPNRSESYYMYQWNKQFNLLRTRWTPKFIYKDVDWEKDPAYILGTMPRRSFQLLRRLSKEPAVIPRLTNPSSIFFLLDLKNFKYSWETWMLFSLKGFDTKINRWNADETDSWHIESLFRELGTLTPENLAQEYKKHSPEALDPLLSNLICRSHKYRSWHKKFKKDAPSLGSEELPEPCLLSSTYSELLKQPSEPTPPAVQLFRDDLRVQSRLHLKCPGCKDEVDYRQRCVHIIVGTPRSDIKRLHGCVISDAPESERLEPKNHGAHGTKMDKEIAWFTTKELGLVRVYPRPWVFKKCKRDIVIFITPDGKHQFGSIIYNAISSSALHELEKQNNMVIREKVMERSPSMMQWAYGDMTAIGTGMRHGGHAGDTYRPYEQVRAETEQQIDKMFDHAKTADTIVSLVKLVDPEAASAMCDDRIGLDPLGTTRCVLFCCQNYLSCSHCDPNGLSHHKMTPAQAKAAATQISTCASASLQYGKTCKPGEYEFVFTKYNIMVYTVPRCLWVFDSDEEHQVTLPSIKTLEAADSPVCSGVHATVPSRNATKAIDLLKARRLYDVVSQYWRDL